MNVAGYLSAVAFCTSQWFSRTIRSLTCCLDHHGHLLHRPSSSSGRIVGGRLGDTPGNLDRYASKVTKELQQQQQAQNAHSLDKCSYMKRDGAWQKHGLENAISRRSRLEKSFGPRTQWSRRYVGEKSPQKLTNCLVKDFGEYLKRY